VLDCIIRGIIGLYDFRVETQSWNESEADQAAAWGSAIFFLIVFAVMCQICAALFTPRSLIAIDVNLLFNYVHKIVVRIVTPMTISSQCLGVLHYGVF
jgi:cobyrinic acid a,c-diamide synthase